MNQGIVYVHSCTADSLNFDKKEILRYMGCKSETPEIKAMIAEFLPKVKSVISPKGSFQYLPIRIIDKKIHLADKVVESENLAKNLEGCEGAVVFALSLGIGADRLISKCFAMSPAAAVCADAISTAAVESYADMLSQEIKNILHKDNLYTRPRFSPGYGDFPLDFQPFFLKLTNAERTLGITLTQRIVMMPTKSVTAIMGVSKSDLKCVKGGCELCENANCKYRR